MASMLSWGVQQGQGLPRRGTKWAPQPPFSLECSSGQALASPEGTCGFGGFFEVFLR